MKVWVRTLLVAALFFTGHTYAIERYIEGTHYQRIQVGNPVPNTVIEFFSFACPHCNKFEPHVHKWVAEQKSEDVQFIRVAVAWSDYYKALAKLYYVMEALGLGIDKQGLVFNAIHKSGRTLQSAAEMQQLLQAMGVKAEDFRSYWVKEDIDQLIEDGTKLESLYQISGVPTMIVNGQYVVKPALVGGEEKVFDLVEYLLAKDAKANQ